MRLAPYVILLVLVVILYAGRDVVKAQLGATVLGRDNADGVHPELQLALDEWSGSFPIKVVSGIRTENEQQSLYAKGRDTEGTIATDAAHASDTAHGRGAAIDAYPAPNGLISYDTDSEEGSARYAEYVSYFKARGFVTKIKLHTGGIDWGHVELSNWRSLTYPPPDYDSMYTKGVS